MDSGASQGCYRVLNKTRSTRAGVSAPKLKLPQLLFVSQVWVAAQAAEALSLVYPACGTHRKLEE